MGGGGIFGSDEESSEKSEDSNDKDKSTFWF